MNLNLFWLAIVSSGCVLASGRLQHPQSNLDSSLFTLTSKNLTVEDILQASARPRKCLKSDTSHAARETRLVYVTPWNPDGYAYTTLHSQRITHVAPVWYQVKLSDGRVTLDGTHNVQQVWLDSLHSDTQVLPRFELSFASTKDIEALLYFPRHEAKDIISCITREVSARGYAGVTLEVPYPAQMAPLITSLGRALHAMTKLLVLVVPAHHRLDSAPPVTRRDLLDMQGDVDMFSLNAYDHATATGQDSGNAPMPWLRFILDQLLTTSSQDQDEDDPFDDEIFNQTIDTQSLKGIDTGLASKVLLGLNFYGYTCTTDGTMNTITAKEYTDLLQFSTVSIPLTIDWHESAGEHRMDGKFWSIWYPTPLSILLRTQLAREYGVGISIWEAGQGVEYLWDVLF